EPSCRLCGKINNNENPSSDIQLTSYLFVKCPSQREPIFHQNTNVRIVTTNATIPTFPFSVLSFSALPVILYDVDGPCCDGDKLSVASEADEDTISVSVAGSPDLNRILPVCRNSFYKD
ncbi:12977_t:CDS:2, partial [Acaulospora morrowiae]